MNQKTQSLESKAAELKIKVHDAFAEFLLSDSCVHTYEISLLDCYRFAGHICHSMTGAFLVTAAAVKALWPETNCCERGDLSIEFGSSINELATGPRSNLISYITGSWAESGFPGLSGKFVRKNLISYAVEDIPLKAVRFTRLSTQSSVTLIYNASELLSKIEVKTEFPQKWRDEITEILNYPAEVISFLNKTTVEP